MVKNTNMKPLYIATDLASLEMLVKKDDNYKSLRKAQRFIILAQKMKAELLQCQDDQEKCYILCRRYLNMMDHLFRISDDKEYLQRLYMTDIRTVTDLIETLKVDLTRRYKEMPLTKSMSSNTSTSSVTVKTESACIKPPRREIRRNPIFKGVFINPGDLYALIEAKISTLIVDIRPASDFEEAHLEIACGNVINIPETAIVPGLSANTLGKKLPEEVQAIWEKRDTFMVMILMDLESSIYNYSGSKLEKLRSFVVQWDFNKRYEQDPVVLNGGIREFVEWYPSKVVGTQFILSRRNSEMDELLQLDEITYPEPNTPGCHSKLKILEVSGDNVEYKFMHEGTKFEEPEEAESNLSEIKVYTDNNCAEPIDTAEAFFQSSLLYDDPGVWELLQLEKERANLFGGDQDLIRENENAIKKIMEANRNIMLEEARKRKPQATTVKDEKPTVKKTDEETTYIVPPLVDRSVKPPTEPIGESKLAPSTRPLGNGFTALQNVENNCFINAILQCVKFLPVIKATYVTSDLFTKITTRQPPKINYLFAHVMRVLWQGSPNKSQSYWPHEFKKRLNLLNPIYMKHNHEDAFEFFIFLFSTISEDCFIEMPRPVVMTDSETAWYSQLQGMTSFFIDSFHHQVRNTRVCPMCHKKSLTFETDSTLMLPIPNTKFHLQDAVNEFLADSSISGYTCERCKSKSTVINSRDIVIHPDVLVVILKRYGVVEDGRLLKNETEVEFPRKNLEFGRENYTLSSIVHHSGHMSVGHYFASVLLDANTDQWVLFNDDKILHCRNIERLCKHIHKEATGFFFVKKDRQPQPTIQKCPPP